MKRVLTGHFGSGKTEIAMQMARDLAAEGREVVLVDLDVVNPYFTSSSHCSELEKEGVRVVAPMYANTNVDVPALTAGARAAFRSPLCDTVVDLGGDSVGAAVMGSLADSLDQAEHFAFLFVVNVYRPFTQTPEEIIQQMERIEPRARMCVCGLVNNANLLGETLPEHLYHGEAVLKEVSRLTGRRILYHCGTRQILNQCKNLSGEAVIMHPASSPFWLRGGSVSY